MNYRKFGDTDLLVSEIGFGAWAIGGGEMIGETAIGWGDVDDNISKKAIHRALDLGINFFDTADIYGLNHSEEIIGKILGDHKEAIIATKVGNVARNKKFTTDYSKDYILKACESSLKRLKRESIDYYQLHTARMADLEKGECIEAMELLKKQGKIRYWGLSLNTFEPKPEADFLMECNLGSGFQLVLNILNQIAVPVMEKASKAGYGMIARMPLQFGLLTGKFDSGAEFPENDHRKGRLTREVVDAYREAMQPVWKLCEKYDIGKTQLALSFILGFDEVSVVIPGIRTPEQAEENTLGLAKLEIEDMQMIQNTNFSKVLEVIRKQG